MTNQPFCLLRGLCQRLGRGRRACWTPRCGYDPLRRHECHFVDKHQLWPAGAEACAKALAGSVFRRPPDDQATRWPFASAFAAAGADCITFHVERTATLPPHCRYPGPAPAGRNWPCGPQPRRSPDFPYLGRLSLVAVMAGGASRDTADRAFQPPPLDSCANRRSVAGGHPSRTSPGTAG